MPGIYTLYKLNKSSCEAILRNNILHFWGSKMVDFENGGFYGQVDGYDQLKKEADKGVILNARILWTYAAAYRVLRDENYRVLANRAWDYLRRKFIDREMGGVYWMLNAEGRPIDRKKQIYAQAFAIYALAEYCRIKENPRVLSEAIELFQFIEQYSLDQEYGGYLEAFDREWRLLDDLRLSNKDANEAKTMNTHLHILEAYTNLYRVWPRPKLEWALRKLIRLLLDRFISNQGHFHLFFDEQWRLKSHEFSYGHDIEGSWLLYEAGEVLGDRGLLEEIEAVSLRMTDAALEGLDQDGGLMNEGDASGIIDTDKHWWPQAEALVGLINARYISKDLKYMGYAEKVWDFTQQKIIDREQGEWHWRVNKSGEIIRSEDKAGPWKCPYHNGRAMLELIERLPK